MTWDGQLAFWDRWLKLLDSMSEVAGALQVSMAQLVKWVGDRPGTLVEEPFKALVRSNNDVVKRLLDLWFELCVQLTPEVRGVIDAGIILIHA